HLTLHNLDTSHLVPGKFGQALSFNGVSQFLSLTNQGQKHLPVYSLGEFTIAMWVRGEERQDNRIVFAEGSLTDKTPLFLFGTHREAKGGQLNVFVRNRGAILNNIPTDGVAFNNQWRHITWVNSGNIGKVYINGELNTEYRYERPTLPLNYLSIGALFREPPAYFFKGEMDEIAIWERSLTTREIKELVTSGIKTEPPVSGAE
ncbi:MAG: LamG domain-containing protein, partial [Limisphaerales bacterium]